MDKQNKISVSLLVSLLFVLNLFAGQIGIIVNKDLYPLIKTAVDRYVAEVKSIEKKEVWLDKDNFSENNTVAELRAALNTHWKEENLEGAILIGDLPIPIYRIDNDKFACDLYYMDMDGNWQGSNPFTNHTGDKKADIWVSRITASVLEEYGGFGQEVEIVNTYFKRVSQRMRGQDTQERNYVIAGQYWEWRGLENENSDYFKDVYAPDKIKKYRSTSDNTQQNHACGDKWMAAIKSGLEYGYIYAHSSPTSHSVGVNLRELAREDIKCRFYHSYACSNADYERGNMCGAYALSDEGLVCVGSTKTGSMKPGTFRAYNRPLVRDKKNFGEAFKDWFNEKGLSDKYWHYGMTLQGVGTLYLTPYSSGPFLEISYPNGGEEWEQGYDYTITWSSNLSGNAKIELLKGGSVKETLAASTPNNGSFKWQVPKDFAVGTDYKVKIKSLDVDTVLSESADNFSITKEYIISEFPHVLTFDSLASNTTILPKKWMQLENDDFDWLVWTGATPSKEYGTTGPDKDHTTGKGNYIYVEASGDNNPNKKAHIHSPLFNLKAVHGDPCLSFFYHMFSDSNHMGALHMDIEVDGNLHSDIIVLDKDDYGDQWHEQKLSLKKYVGERVVFHFRATTGQSYCSDICIDDFKIDFATSSDPMTMHTVTPLGLTFRESRLHFWIPEKYDNSQLNLTLHNLQGKVIKTLHQGKIKAGNYNLSVNKLGSGLYLCTMKIKGFTKTIRILKTK